MHKVVPRQDLDAQTVIRSYAYELPSKSSLSQEPEVGPDIACLSDMDEPKWESVRVSCFDLHLCHHPETPGTKCLQVHQEP